MSEFQTRKISDSAGTGAPNFTYGLNSGGSDSGLIGKAFTSSGTQPSSPANGDLWYDSTNDKLYYYVNSEFKQITHVNAVASIAWGGTRGACRSAAESLVNDGHKIGYVHLRWINPLPDDLGEILIKYKNVLIPEINLGQLIKVIRAEYLVDAKGLNQVYGKPISSTDIQEEAKKLIG